MVYHTLSIRVKKQKKCQFDNEKMQHALDAYTNEQTKEPHLPKKPTRPHKPKPAVLADPGVPDEGPYDDEDEGDEFEGEWGGITG
jgi:hypothetical protein